MGRFRHYSVYLILLLIITGSGVSCVSQHQIVVDLFQPPEIHLPDSLNAVTMLHRVSADDRAYLENNRVSFSGKQEEGLRVVAGERAVFGFMDHLVNSEDKYRLKDNIEWLDTLKLQTYSMPPPLSWNVVERICQNSQTDMLVTLESVLYNQDIQFSTYQRRTHESRNKVWSKTVLYNVEDQTMHKADYVFGITANWRIYEPSSRQIILEKSTTDSISYEVDGTSKEDVEKKLPSNLTAAEKAGFIAGEHFARTILPSYKTVLRYYYGGGNKELRKATTFVRFRNWEEASAIWEDLLETANPAIKAKICYNLALVSEMEGHPDEALSFLSKADQMHRNSAFEQYRTTIIHEWNLNKDRL